MTNNGYKMVNERFGWETIAQKYINIYRTLDKNK